MARQGNKIEPNLELKRYGIGDGWVIVTLDGVSITVSANPGQVTGRERPLEDGHDDHFFPSVMLDPEQAPLFRMIANKLDELAGKRERK